MVEWQKCDICGEMFRYQHKDQVPYCCETCSFNSTAELVDRSDFDHYYWKGTKGIR